MKYILGKKLNMTQLFEENGQVIPVTTVAVGPCYVTHVKTKARDGYTAIQIGFEETKETRLTKPRRGHLKPVGKNLRYLSELRTTEEATALKIGDVISVDAFQKGDIVTVTAVSKGKGFQGVVRRHRFSGSPKTHGHKDQLRMPGSIGATNPQRVVKGRRMAGHMGAVTVTIKNLKIANVDPKQNILYIQGALPGARGTLVKIKGV